MKEGKGAEIVPHDGPVSFLRFPPSALIYIHKGR
jgi:hypothetical protein